MKCEEARNLMGEYCDNELAPEKRVEVENHIEGCASCQEAFSEYQQMFKLLSGLRPHVDKHVMDSVKKNAPKSRAVKWRRTASAIAMAAAVLVVSAVSYGLWLQFGGMGENSAMDGGGTDEQSAADGALYDAPAEEAPEIQIEMAEVAPRAEAPAEPELGFAEESAAGEASVEDEMSAEKNIMEFFLSGKKIDGIIEALNQYAMSNGGPSGAEETEDGYRIEVDYNISVLKIELSEAGIEINLNRGDVIYLIIND
jgi:hypothetical protein